jgi:S1-C subfamily serine protease
MRALKIAGVATAMLGAGALIVVLAPAVGGQLQVKRAPKPLLEMAQQGLWERGRIGVTVRDLDDADVKREKLGSMSGVVIDEVGSDSPAARAGLKAGDVVVELDGERVRSARQFVRLVAETPNGRSIRLGVTRDGQRLNLDVTPEEERSRAEWAWPETLARLDDLHVELPRMPPIDVPGFEVHTLMRSGRLGVRVEALTPQLAEYFGAKGGVLVTTVDQDSAAAKAGLKAGDVITGVNGHTVDDSADLQRELRRAEDEDVTIDIVRDRKSQSLKAKIEPARRPRKVGRRVTAI